MQDRQRVVGAHHVNLQVTPQDAMLPEQLLLHQLHGASLLQTQQAMIWIPCQYSGSSLTHKALHASSHSR